MLALLFSFRGTINRMMFLFGLILQAMLFYLAGLLINFFALPVIKPVIIAAPIIFLWITFSLFIKRYREIGVPWLITTLLFAVPWLVMYLVPAIFIAVIANTHLLESIKLALHHPRTGFLILCGYMLYVVLIYLLIPLFWPGRKLKYGLYG